MAADYRYQLRKGSRKERCPECGKKTFVPFTDTESDEILPDIYGRCDREVKCGYYLNPYRHGFAETKTTFKPIPRTLIKKAPASEVRPAIIPPQVLEETLKGYENNTFIQYLAERCPYPFEQGDIEAVVSLYRLGTITGQYRRGAITFPFIDMAGRIRAIQVKEFDSENHTTGTGFYHSMKNAEFEQRGEPLPAWMENYLTAEKKVSCLFGEHLLKRYPCNPVALTEAPKTAIYGTLYFGMPYNPANFIWLAAFNVSSLNLEKCGVLAGRNVVLFPDLSETGATFEKWSARAREFERMIPGARFRVSTLLEDHSEQSARTRGADLADYLIKLDWHTFRNKTQRPAADSQNVKSEKSVAEKKLLFFQKNTPSPEPYLPPFAGHAEKWDIEELENYFSSATIPAGPIQVNAWTTIADPGRFIEGQIQVLKANHGKPRFRTYFDRLAELKTFVNNKI